jgi:hypothetical protein
MKHAVFSTFVLVCSLAWSLTLPMPLAGAAASWLQGAEISKSLGGKTLEGRYANGRAFTERYLPDGRIEYFEDGNAIGGHWSITAGTLCTIYDTEAAGGCFRVSKLGTNCFEFYFAARTEEAAPGPEGSKPTWTARGSVSGEPHACPDGANV